MTNPHPGDSVWLNEGGAPWTVLSVDSYEISISNSVEEKQVSRSSLRTKPTPKETPAVAMTNSVASRYAKYIKAGGSADQIPLHPDWREQILKLSQSVAKCDTRQRIPDGTRVYVNSKRNRNLEGVVVGYDARTQDYLVKSEGVNYIQCFCAEWVTAGKRPTFKGLFSPKLDVLWVLLEALKADFDGHLKTARSANQP